MHNIFFINDYNFLNDLTDNMLGLVWGGCMFVVLKFYKIKISFSVKFSIVVFNFKKMLQNKQENKSI